MTHMFDMVSMVGLDESEPVPVTAQEAVLFAAGFAALCAAYLPEGKPALMEITPRAEVPDE